MSNATPAELKPELLPEWWPECPYPEDIFTMKREEYPKIVPDPALRTSLSGCLGREFWNIASRGIFKAYQDHLENEKERFSPDTRLREAAKKVHGNITHSQKCIFDKGLHLQQNADFCICGMSDLRVALAAIEGKDTP